MSTALEICAQAFRQQNLLTLSAFGTSLEFPYSIALDILNEVIRFVNRMGNYWFTETKTALPYGVGVYQYTLSSYSIDPQRIRFIRAEATNYWSTLSQCDYPLFLRRYRTQAVPTGQPSIWSKHAGVLELACIPDQDYSLQAYHFKDMPLITSESDTFLVPERDEDILTQSVYQLLGYYIGKTDLQSAQAAIRLIWQPFLVDINQDVGLPSVMPAMF